MTSTRLPPIDPLRPLAHGRYEDDLVVVTRRAARRSDGVVHTTHFEASTQDGRLHITHSLPTRRIDNDLAGLIAGELFGPGWLSGAESFERVLTGVVLTSAPDPVSAWELFYRNTLARLGEPARASAPADGSLAAYRPVYEHAVSLIGPGSVLELGCCFGFLSLQLADPAHITALDVTASDVTANTVRLLAILAPRLGRPLATLVCDAARVPRPDRAFDTVLAIHLLEHLEPDHGSAVLTEALRLARRRVVVAVPFEDTPSAAFGHVRTFTLDELCYLGLESGWSISAYEHHGGWLVLDRR